MKKIFNTLFALLLVAGATAQVKTEVTTTTTTTTTTEDNDTTKVRVGKRTMSISDDGITIGNTDKKPKAEGYWSGIGLGLNVLSTSSGDISLPRSIDEWENEPIRSMTWNLNFYDQFIPITRDRHTVGLVTGLGVTYRSFGFSNSNLDMVTNDDGTALVENPDRTYTKRKFRTTWVSAPALVSFNTSLDKKKNFHIAAGVIGNIRIGSLYKQKFTENGEVEKKKNHDDFNLNPLSADFTVRVGYRDITFFFNYGLTNLFRDGKGPALIPMTFGIQL